MTRKASGDLAVVREAAGDMMARVTNSPETPPTRIPGYDGGPFHHLPELLDEYLFWLGHLHNYYSESEEAEDLVDDTDEQEAGELQSRLLEGGTWPVFTVPLVGEHRLYVAYRAFGEDESIDYLLHHPDWDAAECLAQDEGQPAVVADCRRLRFRRGVSKVPTVGRAG